VVKHILVGVAPDLSIFISIYLLIHLSTFLSIYLSVVEQSSSSAIKTKKTYELTL